MKPEELAKKVQTAATGLPAGIAIPTARNVKRRIEKSWTQESKMLLQEVVNTLNTCASLPCEVRVSGYSKTAIELVSSTLRGKPYLYSVKEKLTQTPGSGFLEITHLTIDG